MTYTNDDTPLVYWKPEGILSITFTAVTSVGSLEVYVDENAWAHAYLLNEEGRTSKEADAELMEEDSLVHVFIDLGLSDREAQAIATSFAAQHGEPHPSRRGRHHNWLRKVDPTHGVDPMVDDALLGLNLGLKPPL